MKKNNISNTKEKKASIDKKVYDLGHRSRVRKRIISAPESSPDYELLELLLFSVHPRKDMRIITKQILHEFGDIPTAAHADPQVLRNVYKLSESVVAVLVTLKEICVRNLRNKIIKKQLLNQTQIVSNYVQTKIGFEDKEVLMALFLDKGYRLIKDEFMSKGTTDYLSVYPKEITSKALLLNASYVILAHNHPSESTSPSADDLAMTKKVIDSLKSVDIRVVDHIIVTKSSNLSFRENLIINSNGNFNDDFDLTSVKDFQEVKESELTEEEKKSFDQVKNLYDSIMENGKKK